MNLLYEKDIFLHDNRAFVDWAVQAQNIYAAEILPEITNDEPLPSEIKETFFAEESVCPFVNVDDHLYAMTTLFYYRIDLGLDSELEISNESIDFSSCSVLT